MSLSKPPLRQQSISELNLSPSSSAFSNLPTELVIYIFSLAASQHKPTAAALARTCRLVREWVEPILYRTVVLTSRIQNELFERTVRSKDPRFFEMHLKHFAPVVGHEELSIVGSPVKGKPYAHMGHHPNGLDEDDVKEDGAGASAVQGCPVQHPSSTAPHSWHAIKGVRSLLLSSLCRPTDESTGHARPAEVAIKGFVKARFFSYPAFEGVTHLFLCEVPMVFTNVLSEIVEALPCLPSLTHLACPYANSWRGPEHNVRDEVCTLLGIKVAEDGSFSCLFPPAESDDSTEPQLNTQIQPRANDRTALSRLNTTSPPSRLFSSLSFLLINVFHYSLPDLERESSIWSQLVSIPPEFTEGRLYVQPGEHFSVKRWEESVNGGRGGIEDGEDVWSEARRRAEGWRSWVRC